MSLVALVMALEAVCVCNSWISVPVKSKAKTAFWDMDPTKGGCGGGSTRTLPNAGFRWLSSTAPKAVMVPVNVGVAAELLEVGTPHAHATWRRVSTQGCPSVFHSPDGGAVASRSSFSSEAMVTTDQAKQ